MFRMMLLLYNTIYNSTQILTYESKKQNEISYQKQSFYLLRVGLRLCTHHPSGPRPVMKLHWICYCHFMIEISPASLLGQKIPQPRGLQIGLTNIFQMNNVLREGKPGALKIPQCIGSGEGPGQNIYNWVGTNQNIYWQCCQDELEHWKG